MEANTLVVVDEYRFQTEASYKFYKIMIVRIQIMKMLPDGTRCIAYKWAIYSIDKQRSFLDLFNDIKNGKTDGKDGKTELSKRTYRGD